ncbi:MAG: outer membrane beta-barrel protein [Candidatus Aminicenantales bacterium]
MKKALIGILLILAVAAAGAKAEAGVFYLGVQGGLSQQKAKLSDIKFNSDTSFLYGLKGGIKIATLALELNYFQAAHNLTSEAGGGWDNRAIDYNYLGANLKWIFPLLVVQPYITVGYGYYTADIHDFGKDKNGGFNAGAGVELVLGKSFSISAEGKYHHVKLNVDAQNLSLGNFTLSGGLNFYF